MALDRALELNPALGEAWIERAVLAHVSRDAVKAEELYRKGLALAPSYVPGTRISRISCTYEYRKGEAIEMIERARQIDPLTPELHSEPGLPAHGEWQRRSGARSSAARGAGDQPRSFGPALIQLAHSNYEYSGEFAEAIRLLERAIALDPAGDGRSLAATVYLDLDDPVAAMAVLGKSPDHESAEVKIAQYQRDRRRAAELARRVTGHWQTAPIAPVAEALRDDAIATGDYAPALKQLEARYSMR